MSIREDIDVRGKLSTPNSTYNNSCVLMRNCGQVCIIALIQKLNLQALREKMPSRQTKHKISKPPLELGEVVGGRRGPSCPHSNKGTKSVTVSYHVDDATEEGRSKPTANNNTNRKHKYGQGVQTRKECSDPGETTHRFE